MAGPGDISNPNKARSAARKARLGQELRANLKRRKEQARARADNETATTKPIPDKSTKTDE